jgi:hypothetical protein
MFPQLSTPQMVGWGLFISPKSKLDIGIKVSKFTTDRTLITPWPDADHALTGCVRSLPNGRLATGMLHWSIARPSSVTCDRTRLVTLEPLWNLSGVDRTLLLACPVTPLSLHLVIAEHAALVNSNACASSPCEGRVRSPLPSLFLCDLVSGLVPIFVLGLCLISWIFSCATLGLAWGVDHRITLSPSSKSRFAPY